MCIKRSPIMNWTCHESLGNYWYNLCSILITWILGNKFHRRFKGEWNPCLSWGSSSLDLHMKTLSNRRGIFCKNLRFSFCICFKPHWPLLISMTSSDAFRQWRTYTYTALHFLSTDEFNRSVKYILVFMRYVFGSLVTLQVGSSIYWTEGQFNLEKVYKSQNIWRHQFLQWV